jgi:hypothetical protein
MPKKTEAWQTVGGVGVDIDRTGEDVTVLIDRFLVPAVCQLVKTYPVMENDQIVITIRRKKC